MVRTASSGELMGMLACPNCGVELDLSEMGEVCSNCGFLVPYEADYRVEDEEELDSIEEF